MKTVGFLNAMILKAAFPEVNLTVDASCYAGVTVDSHHTALNAMKSAQIGAVQSMFGEAFYY